MNGKHPMGNEQDCGPTDLPSIAARLDFFGRQHPRLMLAVTLVAAILATLMLLAQPQGAVVLYQAF